MQAIVGAALRQRVLVVILGLAVIIGGLFAYKKLNIEAYPDPTAEQPAPWVVVDLKAVKSFKQPVTLAEIKATPALAKMALVTSMRLSVQPVTEAEWALLCKMGGL